MIAFPALTAVVLAVLSYAVYGQWRSRHRSQQLAWTVALLWGLIGTLAYIGAILAGDNAWLFRLYYMGGAVLIAPLLGVGSAYLLPNKLWARLLLGITILSAALAAVGLLAFPLNTRALADLAAGAGTGVVTSGVVIVPLVVGNALGTVAVVGVALRSIFAAVFGGRPWGLVWGNGLIAVGALLIAEAGSVARLGNGEAFWGTMTVGWIVLYGGFALMAAAVPESVATAAA